MLHVNRQGISQSLRTSLRAGRAHCCHKIRHQNADAQGQPPQCNARGSMPGLVGGKTSQRRSPVFMAFSGEAGFRFAEENASTK